MQEFIITTPEQLILVISETVKKEITKHYQDLPATAPQADQENDILTRQQAAKLLGISLPTLNEWSKSGIITGYRISTRVRYKRSELEKSLLQMQTPKSQNTRKKRG